MRKAKRLIIILGLLLTTVGVPSEGTYWCWDEVPGAYGYNLMYGDPGQLWQVLHFTTATCSSAPLPTVSSGEIVFFVVTAVNLSGESPTEHGDSAPPLP